MICYHCEALVQSVEFILCDFVYLPQHVIWCFCLDAESQCFPLLSLYQPFPFRFHMPVPRVNDGQYSVLWCFSQSLELKDQFICTLTHSLVLYTEITGPRLDGL